MPEPIPLADVADPNAPPEPRAQMEVGDQPAPELDGLRQPNAVDIWLFCTDRGSDEVGARGMMKQQVCRIHNSLVLDVDCFCHQYQTIVKSQLIIANNILKSWGSTVTYTAALSKLMLCWRDHARQIFDVWHSLYGSDSALRCARRLTPKCIPGRWGAISACENFVLRCPWEQLVDVLTTCLDITTTKKKHKVMKRPASADAAPGDLGIASMEEEKEY